MPVTRTRKWLRQQITKKQVALSVLKRNETLARTTWMPWETRWQREGEALQAELKKKREARAATQRVVLHRIRKLGKK